MKGRIRDVVLNVHPLCNLNCTYCYMYKHEDRTYLTRPHSISEEVFDRLLLVMRTYSETHSPHAMTLTFHGGEPTLIGARRFEALVVKARKALAAGLREIVMQTNGTLLNAAWLKVITDYDIRVGLSIDGPVSIHDSTRVDHAGRGSYHKAIAGLTLLQKASVKCTVLAVVNPGADGLAVYRHFRELGISDMDFLLPDVSHDNKANFYPDCGPHPVADFLLPIFDAWFSEDNPDIRIRLFCSLIGQMLGGPTQIESFGNPLMDYVIVASDGAIEVLDSLAVCEEGMTSTGLNILRDGFDDLSRASPLARQALYEGVPLAPVCEACVEKSICGGGCIPHRYSKARGFNNPSVWCADILRLLSHIRAAVSDGRS